MSCTALVTWGQRFTSDIAVPDGGSRSLGLNVRFFPFSESTPLWSQARAGRRIGVRGALSCFAKPVSPPKTTSDAARNTAFLLNPAQGRIVQCGQRLATVLGSDTRDPNSKAIALDDCRKAAECFEHCAVETALRAEDSF